MQIEKAYLFARQITVGEVPMDQNTYFENGVFNPVWVGDNFDYTDSDIVRGSYWDVQYDAMHYSSYIAAHKVVHAVGNLANPWFIEDGDLVFRQSAFSSFNDNTSEVFLPINLALSQINPYVTRMYVLIMQTDLLNASYKTTHSRHCYYDYPTMDAIEVSSTGQTSPSRVTDGYEDYWCDLFPQIETWSQDIPSYISVYTNGYKEVRIKKIWFTDLNT